MTDYFHLQLQEAFARGELKPGLNIEYNPQKERVNNIVSS